MSRSDDADLEAFRQHCRPPESAVERNWAALSATIAEEVAAAPRVPTNVVRLVAWGAGIALAAALAALWIPRVVVTASGGDGDDGNAALRSHDRDETGGRAVSRDDEGDQPEIGGAVRASPSGAGRSDAPRTVDEPVSLPVADAGAEEPDSDSGGVEASSERRSPKKDARPKLSGDPPPAVQPETTPDRLRQEAALIGAARASIRKGQHAAALAKLREHEQAFPHGAMKVDREAWIAIALCRTGKVIDGARLGRAFVAARPSSTHAEGIREACEIE